MLVIAEQRNIRRDQTCYVINELLIQKTDMSVKLVANILQESLSLQVTNVFKKKDEMEQEQLAEETGPLAKRRRQITKSIQSKAVVERELNSGVELTKKDTLKQFDESEKETQDNKKNINESKQTITEHATNEKMLARVDEADSFSSFGSMADRHWKHGCRNPGRMGGYIPPII